MAHFYLATPGNADALANRRLQQWCIPSVDAEYGYRMEDLLDLYAEPPNPQRPRVCFDELP